MQIQFHRQNETTEIRESVINRNSIRTEGRADPADQTAASLPDYGTYSLSRREQIFFHSIGFVFFALIAYLFYRSLLLSVLAGLLIRRCQPLYERHLAQKRQKELNEQFQDLLGSLSASITAGRHMEDALIEACDNLSLMYGPETPIMLELQSMKTRIQNNHESDRMLLTDFARRSHSEDVLSFTQVYLTCRSTGGDLQRVIAHTSEIITEKMQINDQIHAIIAQKKLEGRLISLMPAAMLLALNLLSSSYISILYTTLAGRLIMTVCLAGTIAGVFLMERLASVEI